MKFAVKICLVFVFAGALCSCATTDETASSAPPSGRRELPWNTPQSWEGMGPLGGYAEMMGSR